MERSVYWCINDRETCSAMCLEPVVKLFHRHPKSSFESFLPGCARLQESEMANQGTLPGVRRQQLCGQKTDTIARSLFTHKTLPRFHSSQRPLN